MILLVLLIAAAVAKWAYWRWLDRSASPMHAASALALAPGSQVRNFEHPHTEANFLLKEMGFALARKHARRLRALSLLLLAGVPALVLLPAHTWPALRVPAAAILLPAVTCGVFIERWLFFAEARHVVMTYYQPQGRSG